MSVVDITSEDPFVNPTKDFIQDPYPYYDHFREKGNLVWSSAGEKRWFR